MANKQIQELIGQRAIEAFADFARTDIRTVDQLEAAEFSHVRDARLRRALAQVLYGARWIYKLGLVTLVRNEERAAHVRAQIVDYTAICEALLSYCIGHAIENGHVVGTAHNFSNPDERNPTKRKAIPWGRGSTESNLRRQSLWWHARIAREFGILNKSCFDDLDWLREERNAVHIRQKVALGETAYLGESRKAFAVLNDCIQQTRAWHAAHPQSAS